MEGTKIVNIFWERTYLYIELQSDEPVEVALYQKSSALLCPFSLESREGNRSLLKINLMIAEGKAPLRGGMFALVYNRPPQADDDPYERVLTSEDVLLAAEEYDRVFRYRKHYAYVITFRPSPVVDDEGNLLGYTVVMRASYMQTNRHPQHRNVFYEARSFFGFFKRCFKLSCRKLAGLYYRILTILFPKNGRRILFMSENRTAMSANLHAIERRMKERGLEKDYILSHSFRNIFDEKHSPVSWLRLTYRISRQDFIFVDDYAPIFDLFTLDRRTELVQTWHAGFGFKAVGYRRFGLAGSPHPYQSCHRKYTRGLVPCEEMKEIFTEVWGVPREILLASGLPRLDHFLDQDHMDAVRKEYLKRFPILSGRTVVLFAPTYRGTGQKRAFYEYDRLDYEKLHRYCEECNAVIVFKMHHFIKEPVPIPEAYSDRLIELKEENINDLFYVTDVLITDYSSCFSDYALLRRPVLFYAYDEKEYAATRGIHGPMEKYAPGKICHTFDELVTALREKDYAPHKSVKVFIDRSVDGGKKASDIVIDEIILKKTQ